MPEYNKVSGVWKESVPSVKVSGVWKDVDKGYVKVSGLWKEFYSSAPPTAIFDLFNITAENVVNAGGGNITMGIKFFINIGSPGPTGTSNGSTFRSPNFPWNDWIDDVLLVSNYEVRATVLAGTLYTAGGAFITTSWKNMNSVNNVVACRTTGSGTSTVTAFVEIRDVATSTIQASATYTLKAISN